MTKDKAMVTDAMVEAFVLTSSIAPGDNVDRIKAGLSEALTLERGEAEPVAVKPLRWKGPDASGEYHSLDGLWGYIIRAGNGNGFWLTEVGGYFRSVEGAQYAAQYDYETRILSTLSKRGEAEETPAAVQHVVARPTFPILNSDGARIDYQLVADHGGQAQKNHYQSVERLAQRGGLSWSEIHAVLHGRAFQKIDQNTAIIECRALEARYLAALDTPPPQPTELAAVSTPSPEGRI